MIWAFCFSKIYKSYQKESHVIIRLIITKRLRKCSDVIPTQKEAASMDWVFVSYVPYRNAGELDSRDIVSTFFRTFESKFFACFIGTALKSKLGRGLACCTMLITDILF